MRLFVRVFLIWTAWLLLSPVHASPLTYGYSNSFEFLEEVPLSKEYEAKLKNEVRNLLSVRILEAEQQFPEKPIKILIGTIRQVKTGLRSSLVENPETGEMEFLKPEQISGETHAYYYGYWALLADHPYFCNETGCLLVNFDHLKIETEKPQLELLQEFYVSGNIHFTDYSVPAGSGEQIVLALNTNFGCKGYVITVKGGKFISREQSPALNRIYKRTEISRHGDKSCLPPPW